MPMPTDLTLNATAFLQKRYPQATVSHKELTFHSPVTGAVFTGSVLIAQDPAAGVKQRLIAITDLGSDPNILGIYYAANERLSELDSSIYISHSNANVTSHAIDTTQMLFSPKVVLYTNNLHMPHRQLIETFTQINVLIEIVNEADMYSTVFISYGGPDEQAASHINAYLKRHGIQTSFFLDDATPGEKLHRWMHNGVNSHDRVLLICSEQSLSRPGVLNEIERVLEREAKEGGSSILMPITLDDYVYTDWAPDRRDLADQVRTRIIIKIDMSKHKPGKHDPQLDRLVKALAR